MGRNKGEKREKGRLARETPFSCQLSLYPRSKTSLRGIQLPLFYWGECKERFFAALRARTSDFCDMVHPKSNKPHTLFLRSRNPGTYKGTQSLVTKLQVPWKLCLELRARPSSSNGRKGL